jgi:hypothetical protein
VLSTVPGQVLAYRQALTDAAEFPPSRTISTA